MFFTCYRSPFDDVRWDGTVTLPSQLESSRWNLAVTGTIGASKPDARTDRSSMPICIPSVREGVGMSLIRLFGKRIAFGFVTAFTVLTTVFAAFNLTEDWVLRGIRGNMRFAGMSSEEIERRTTEYMTTRGLDEPLFQRYRDWMIDMFTFDWGASIATGEPALAMVRDGLWRTSMYVLPALALAIILGIGFGLYRALRPESTVASLCTGTAYLAFALPNVWVGGMLFSLEGSLFDAPPLLFDHVLPIVLTTTTLLGAYTSYARAHALEYSSSEFIRLVKAKGGGFRLMGRHVVRNALIPFVSMAFIEALALLVLSVFVIETLFAIDGFGLRFITAVEARDLPVILGSSLTIVIVAIVGNILQDLGYTMLDPRVDTGAR